MWESKLAMIRKKAFESERQLIGTTKENIQPLVKMKVYFKNSGEKLLITVFDNFGNKIFIQGRTLVRVHWKHISKKETVD